MTTIGEVIKALRKERKLTLSDVADQIPGYDAGNLSRVERNKQNITNEKLESVCKVLNVKTSDVYLLIEGEPVRENKPKELNQEVAQYNNIKDFSKHTDKLNRKQLEKLEELMSYYVVLPEKYQNQVLGLTESLYDMNSKLNSIARRRSPPDGMIIEESTNGGKKRDNTSITDLQK